MHQRLRAGPHLVELLPRNYEFLLLPLEEGKPLANLPIGGTMRPCVTVDGRLEGRRRPHPLCQTVAFRRRLMGRGRQSRLPHRLMRRGRLHTLRRAPTAGTELQPIEQAAPCRDGLLRLRLGRRARQIQALEPAAALLPIGVEILARILREIRTLFSGRSSCKSRILGRRHPART